MIAYRHFIAFYIIAFSLILDQAIKIAVETHLNIHQPIYILPFFFLCRTHNTGVSFSFFSDVSPWIIMTIRFLIISFTIFMWTKYAKNNNVLNIGFILIISGALGNLMDQCTYGYVVDYIMIQIRDISFPIFNLADTLISIGAFLIIYNETMTSYE
ncbi:signal peptidase II [Candidatus Liberibacter americanus]|uniref:Lipoprotein signal peptidase n=1 Tax=Candidatus Liberibacter americanus str. Sao Paulo TaxID=1261131 RepID=U6B4N1_9HYPH|nr:signal peptidase II [Candidatus Liberibacter americanus]AHA27583.1 Lipoprotein signal peptidase [Candidatus Liberibacter americanus str. Sao Paulo]EMS36456.1 lipoprotein signal peptidase [Candidatus Liberibacter americanus PW_SP]